MMRPGLTTATQYSGAPFPFPIRVSAGFFVTGLSGNMRIQTLPPRLTNRVIAIRPASICRSVIQAASSVFNPKSPNSSDEPRHALPLIRPRCCLRYFTFFGINMRNTPFRNSDLPKSARPKSDTCCGRTLRRPAGQDLAFINPALDSNDSVRGVGLSEAVIHIRAQGMQRQPALQIPFGPGDFRAIQPAADANLDPFGAEAEGRIDGS